MAKLIKQSKKTKLEKLRCFVALPHSLKYESIKEAIREGANEAGFQVVSLDQGPVFPGSTIQDTLISELAQADCIIADISDRNPNIFYELGLAQAMGKGILLISKEHFIREVPFDIREYRIISYDENNDNLISLSKRIYISLREFRKFPRQKILSSNFPLSAPFFIEWDKLSDSEAENLCQELLAQLGFRRLYWDKTSTDIDLIAELPKKDPDGYEYRELWVVSLGLRGSVERLIEMASSEPEYLLHRFMRYSNNMDDWMPNEYDKSITILLVLFKKSASLEDIEIIRSRLNRRRNNRVTISSPRFRIWDQNYLTSLVQRFPNIGYKYFSDEGRYRSLTRKSYEDLYTENSTLSSRQAKLITELQEEKNMRIRAERDSIWKDISFSAAHKMGNPIFAIETDLDPLLKRIREDRKGEAEEVVDNIQMSVEKAKAVVEQFKSLAKAQLIKPVPTLLKPILEDACKSLSNHDVICKIECPPDLMVNGDPDRLAECFDELVANALHWFDKPEKKKIEIIVSSPAPEPLPSFLDTTQKYVLVHVLDNGCGIPTSDKNLIFNAFYTKYDHGTGLGLALVRRIIDGHGGGIIETGIPQKGADFEMYIPLSDGKDKEIKNILKKKPKQGIKAKEK